MYLRPLEMFGRQLPLTTTNLTCFSEISSPSSLLRRLRVNRLHFNPFLSSNPANWNGLGFNGRDRTHVDNDFACGKFDLPLIRNFLVKSDRKACKAVKGARTFLLFPDQSRSFDMANLFFLSYHISDTRVVPSSLFGSRWPVYTAYRSSGCAEKNACKVKITNLILGG